MLTLLRNNHNNVRIRLNRDFYKDLQWFITFLQCYNVVTYYNTKKVGGMIYLDASLTPVGGVYETWFIHFLSHCINCDNLPCNRGI